VRGLLAVVMLLAFCGCHGGSGSAPPPVSAAPGHPAQLVDSVYAYCAPPDGWSPEPLKSSANHTHQVWISPSGQTAYGVIHFMLPLPVSHEAVLWVFMNEMKRTEGNATLLEKKWDPALGGIRFVARGHMYTVRTNLLVRGFDGWAVYAGTLSANPVQADELTLAEDAREHTEVATHTSTPKSTRSSMDRGESSRFGGSADIGGAELNRP
jgi:hypothetical protein